MGNVVHTFSLGQNPGRKDEAGEQRISPDIDPPAQRTRDFTKTGGGFPRGVPGAFVPL